MKIIHVLRKPPSESTVAANTLKHGTGGLNIAASRIGTRKRVPKGLSRAAPGFSVRGFSDGGFRNETGNEDGHNPNIGRFPANVILQHLDGCRCDGVIRVDHADEDGQETVADWICEPGCPVARLNEQSSDVPSSGIGGAARYFKQVGGKRVE
jgi:hypothetical protein